MKRINNIAPLAILMALISISLVPLALYGNRVGYHCLNMAQSFAMFCLGAWISEYLRTLLNRGILTMIGIFAGVCILQYFALEVYALTDKENLYIARKFAPACKCLYYSSFVLFGIMVNVSWSKKIQGSTNEELVVYPFRSNDALQKSSGSSDNRFVWNCLGAIICFSLYLTMKLLPEKFYSYTSEIIRLLSRTFAIIPWMGTLLFLYKCLMSHEIIRFTNRYPRLREAITSMLPAAILLMLPVHTMASGCWWEDIARFPIYLIVLSIIARFTIRIIKCLFSKGFGWKYIILGYH